MIIELNLPKATEDLSGNKLGRTVYNEQIKEKLNNVESVKVVIPEQIHDVGASFVQGIYAYLSEKYGKARALDIMQLECINEDANKKVQRIIGI